MRNGYRRQLYRIFFRKYLRDIPRIIAVILIVSIISLGVIAGIVLTCGEDVSKVNVGYVFLQEDTYFKVGLKYMARSANCNFLEFDTEEEGIESLEDKDIAALLVVYDNPDEQTPDNPFPITSLKFIYYDTGDFVTSAFSNIVTSGLRDFMVLNSTSDAVRRTTSEYSRSELSQLEDDLLDYLWHRNKYYEKTTFNDSGDLPLKYYYMGNAVVLITLLSASVVIGFSKNDERQFLTSVRRVGITEMDLLCARNLPIILFYSAISVITSIIAQLIIWDEINPWGILAAFLGTVLTLSPVILIHELIQDRTVSTLCCVFYSIISMFLSGNIIPLTFLPKQMESISKFILTGDSCRLMGQMLYSTVNARTLVMALIWMLGLGVLTAALTIIRSRKNVQTV